MRSPGFVYVMTNPRLPGSVKIGKTSRPPEDSTREWNAAGDAETLHVSDAAYFSDHDAAEYFVQEYLATFRDPEKPDYYQVPVEIAMRALSAAMERHVGTRTARQHNSSLYDSGAMPTSDQTATSVYEDAESKRRESPAEAITLFKRAGRLGEPRAFIALAEMHERGDGVPADSKRALEWLEEGARSNARECFGQLADRYDESGKSNSDDYRKAHKWIRDYFQGMDLVGIADEHVPVVLVRLRLFMKVCKMHLEAEDQAVVPGVIEGLRTRIQHSTDAAARRAQLASLEQLSVEWQTVTGKRKPAMSPLLKLVLGGSLLTAFAWFGVPGMRQMVRIHQPAAAPAPVVEEKVAEEEPVKKPATPSVAAKTKAPRQTGNTVANAPDRGAGKSAGISSSPKAVDPAPAEFSPAQTLVTKAPSPPPIAPVTKLEVSAAQLSEHYDVNKERANATFKNEPVRISDVITKVGKHDVSFKKVKCKMQGDPPAGLTPGQTVTVEGTVRGKAFWSGTIVIEGCHIAP